MPIASSMHLPKPKAWDEFEDMVCDAMKIRWENSGLTRHGRLGQAQQGVDIYGNNDLGLFSGIQCKNTVSRIDQVTIEAEIKNAENFKPQIKTLYIATTADTDAQLQECVRLLAKKRKNKGLFSVEILFWNDLQQDITKDKNILMKYYPQIFPSGKHADEYKNQGNKKLCVFAIAYIGLRISEYIELIFGEMGMLASEDPGQFTQLCIEIKAYAKQLFENDQYENICRSLNEIENLCFKRCDTQEENDSRWERAISLGKITEKRIKVLETELSGELLRLFILGEILAFLDMINFNTFEEYHATVIKYHKEIIKGFKALGVSGSTLDEIDKKLKYAARDESLKIFNVPAKLYAIARESIKNLNS